LEFVKPEDAVYVNRNNDHGEEKDGVWIQRETRILEEYIEVSRNGGWKWKSSGVI